jgi:arylsulfatase A-like enzyme
MPTMLDLAGVEHPETVQGKSLVDVIKGSKRQTREFAVTSGAIVHPPVSDVPLNLESSNWDQFARALKASTIVTYEWTLIVGAGDLQPQMYHNPSDPHQHVNVFSEHKDVAKRLHADYIELLESLGTKEEYIAPRRVLPGV